MPSPGAKSFPGWCRFTLGFVRFYCLGLAVLALLLLTADMLWPGIGLATGVQRMLTPSSR